MSTVTVDMTKREVKRLLGPPHQKTSTKEYLRQSSGFVILGGSVPNQEFWLYVGVPPGHDTQVVLEGGRVVEVSTPPSRG